MTESTRRITVYLPSSELARVETSAAAARLGINPYINAAIIDHCEVPPPPGDCDAYVEVELNDTAAKMIERACERGGATRSEVVRAAIGRALQARRKPGPTYRLAKFDKGFRR